MSAASPPPWRSIRVIRGRSASHAPLIASTVPPSRSARPPARRASVSKANDRVRDDRTSATGPPASPRASATATSRGSPEKPSSVARVSDAINASSRHRARASSASSLSPAAPVTWETARRLSVSVPVLSVQITCTAPNASTALRPFTSTFRRAMRRLPTASERVKVGSNPSGTLATMIPIMNTRFTHSDRPLNTP